MHTGVIFQHMMKVESRVHVCLNETVKQHCSNNNPVYDTQWEKLPKKQSVGVYF